MVYKFGQLFEIIDGDRGKNYPGDSDFFDEGYCLFLNAGNVTKSGWSFESNAFIAKEKDEQLRKGRVNRGDTVFTTRGTVGNAAYYGDKVPFENIRINSGMVILRPKDEAIVDNEFIYYLVTSPLAKKTIELYCSGSAQPQLPIKDFVKIKYDLPSIAKQRQIVSVLNSFDNLIEINNKRIKVLEQMAENLYKEWFVRFRFPGHESVPFENGLPKGWIIKRVDAIGEVIGGGTPSTNVDSFWDGTIPWLTPADLSNTNRILIRRGSTNISSEGLKRSGATMMPPDTVLVSSRAPVGYLAIAANPICTNQGFKSIVCFEGKTSPYYLFFFLRSNREMLHNYATGATFPELSVNRMKKIKILVPDYQIQHRFETIAKGIICEMDKLEEANDLLKHQRDLLLPRLMSGKLEV